MIVTASDARNNNIHIKNLQIPESVIRSARFVVRRAHDVQVKPVLLETLRQPIRQALLHDKATLETAFGTTHNLEHDANLIFFETAANFCFWSQDGQQTWRVGWKNEVTGGWYGLSRAFYRAVQERIPVYDAAFMAQLTVSQGKKIFRGIHDVPIPLLEQRVHNIVEAAQFLLLQHKGSTVHFAASCDFSAPKIAVAAVQYLPSYRDGSLYEDTWTWTLKRAQILPSDLSQLTQKYPNFHIVDLQALTAFADYRLPQVLRHYGVLQYSERLADIIDSKQLLPSQSPEEIEIRMATIIACNMLAKLDPDLSSADIDLGLWLLSQQMRNDSAIPPHHMTISSYY